jgi:nitroreductase
MNFSTLSQSRRSCRFFDSSPVTDDQLAVILKAGQWAPSPLNLQPWEFIIITEPEIKTQVRKIGEAARQEVIDGGGPSWAGKYEMAFIEEAPVLIVVAVDPFKGGLGDYFNQKYGALQAGSACVQNIMLAAAELGFGSLWFTFFRPEKLKAALKIPGHLEIAAVIPIGKPKEPIKAPPRKKPRIYRQRYQDIEQRVV